MKKFFVLASFVAASSMTSVASAAKLNGNVKIDGSSTVFPITEAIAEEYRAEQPDVRVTVGVSGTGGGFKKFLALETDINDASRSIKGSEIEMAKAKGIEYLELPVAYDGITVIVNPKNDWANSMTSAELKKIWEPGSKVTLWSDVRPEWPKREIKLYGPGTESGTFDYFTEAINGKSHVSRSDFTMSEDDNVLVRGVSGDKDALGFLGFAYYSENKSKLKAVSIKHGGNGGVLPTLETINNGSYAPLSRPVFIYVSKKAAMKPQVFNFVNFYLSQAGSLVSEVGYVPLGEKTYAKAKEDFAQFVK